LDIGESDNGLFLHLRGHKIFEKAPKMKRRVSDTTREFQKQDTIKNKG
jgi:hypothetical protein